MVRLPFTLIPYVELNAFGRTHNNTRSSLLLLLSFGPSRSSLARRAIRIPPRAPFLPTSLTSNIGPKY
jgi:hypothetical protein